MSHTDDVIGHIGNIWLIYYAERVCISMATGHVAKSIT